MNSQHVRSSNSIFILFEMYTTCGLIEYIGQKRVFQETTHSMKFYSQKRLHRTAAVKGPSHFSYFRYISVRLDRLNSQQVPSSSRAALIWYFRCRKYHSTSPAETQSTLHRGKKFVKSIITFLEGSIKFKLSPSANF